MVIREHLQTNVKYIFANDLPNYILAWKCTFLESFLFTGPLASGNWLRPKLIQIPALLHHGLPHTPCGKQAWKEDLREEDGSLVLMPHANGCLPHRRLVFKKNSSVQIWALCACCPPCWSLVTIMSLKVRKKTRMFSNASYTKHWLQNKSWWQKLHTMHDCIFDSCRHSHG